jgi:hypothetical protein
MKSSEAALLRRSGSDAELLSPENSQRPAAPWSGTVAAESMGDAMAATTEQR